MGKGLSTTQAVLLGCGSVLLVMLVVIGLLGVSCFHMAQDPQGILVDVDSPTDVAVGETFDLVVRVTNNREKKSVVLTDLDVGTDYLDHFVVVSTDPDPESTQDNAPFDASRSFTHNLSIPPGETRSFTFTLRAEHEGLFRDDLDVCEGMRFLTRMLQTSVKPAEE